MFDCAIPTCLGRHGATLVQGEQTKVADAPKLNRLSVGKHVSGLLHPSNNERFKSPFCCK
ncbi:hypothetical protein CSQ80_16700 [Cyanobacterium aponinum IPPAS B-1201]|nr:hypothetical protein CSQ80_16700 [Cyanobacterium aponinum IPPAS B-1201]